MTTLIIRITLPHLLKYLQNTVFVEDGKLLMVSCAHFTQLVISDPQKGIVVIKLDQ